MKNKKILIIGPYPPPFGGVSIHIKRLKELLAGSFNIDIVDEARVKKENIFNIRSLNAFKYLYKVFTADIVHLHSGLLSLRLIHFFTACLFFKKKIITIHGYEPGRGKIERTLDTIMLNNSSKVIFVSKEIAERFNAKKYIIKDAFLPPVVKDEADLPTVVLDWVANKKEQGYIVSSANAWRLDSHKNEDLYGLDLCILTAKKLQTTGVKAAFVFVVCEDTGVIKIEQYRRMIIELGIEDCFLLYEAPLSFIKLILNSDIVIRPTNTDGDALTVREGLFLGKTVIASDVVLRPQGTILFKNRDAASLAKAITGVNDKDVATKQIDINSQASYASFYIDNIYN